MATLVEKYTKLSAELYQLCSRKQMIQRQCIGLGRMECELLNYLNKMDDAISMNELATQLKVSHSRITRIIDTLVKKKLVKRFPSKKDRRSWLAEITDQGEKANKQTILDFQSIQKDLLKKFPEDEVEQIYDCIKIYLEKFNEVLSERKKSHAK
ncbi:MAG: MarR family transcriptional regulator [Candidatus Cloacimonetes bacterium]|nr:MarR family transcriptional regulator [Candidatus Cloacimonadota bacterium]